MLKIKQTCEGIVLVNVADEEALFLDYQPLNTLLKINSTKEHLIGEWTNVTAFKPLRKSAKTSRAFLNYQFFTDGTFTCKYGNKNKTIAEEGTWEISKDGRFLLLQNGMGQTQVIKISQVDNHGLVLEQVMETNTVGEFFGVSNRVFAFIK